MKFIDNIINKIGHDKVIHFSQAGWLTQIGGLFGFLKEKYLDDTFDKNDIKANLFGCILATIINILVLIL